jgi:cytochrome bd-type quinol oxidase subunit 2
MTEIFVKVLNKTQTWEFIAISLLSIGSFLTLGYSFFPREKLQRISLFFFLAGALSWISIILYQIVPLANREINQIGYLNFLVSLGGLCVALGSAWMWIKRDRYLWFISMAIGIFTMLIFDIFKKL